MKAVLLIDFGSTYTKITAVDVEEEKILGTAQSFTTIETDINDGLNNALAILKEQIGEIEFSERYACSSAAGGLRMVAIGLVLPGISVSQMLYMLGIYEGIMQNISTLNIVPLIPLGIGVVGGIFLTTRVLENLMKGHPQSTYLIILGFMFGSLPELFPGIPGGMTLVFSVLTAALGFAAIYFMSLKESGMQE